MAACRAHKTRFGGDLSKKPENRCGVQTLMPSRHDLFAKASQLADGSMSPVCTKHGLRSDKGVIQVQFVLGAAYCNLAEVYNLA